jgi:mono/diheme cytochrome c family protein
VPRSLRRTLALGAATAFIVAACGQTTDTTGSDIPPQDPALVSRGAERYQAGCAECHGSDLRGTDRGPSHLSVVYKPSRHGDAAFLLAVLRGSPAHHWRFGDMPPVEGLTSDDVDAIVAYVRETQRLEGFERYPP